MTDEWDWRAGGAPVAPTGVHAEVGSYRTATSAPGAAAAELS